MEAKTLSLVATLGGLVQGPPQGPGALAVAPWGRQALPLHGCSQHLMVHSRHGQDWPAHLKPHVLSSF